ncbi:MAG: tRNA dihydrouridine synthase [Clostridia bacterium]
MIQTLKIGDVSLKNNLILAPMAGVTDLPFRLLCKEQGAGLLCMEMVSAKAIYFNNKNTEELLTIDDREPPVSLQLFGSDPDIISEMAKKIENRPFSILDINMGCPVPKVAGNGEGSALMKIRSWWKRSVKLQSHQKPVAVKIRKVGVSISMQWRLQESRKHCFATVAVWPDRNSTTVESGLGHYPPGKEAMIPVIGNGV